MRFRRFAKAVPIEGFNLYCYMTPEEVRCLGMYNAEVSRGVVHTDETRAAMAALQARFDEWSKKGAGR